MHMCAKDEGLRRGEAPACSAHSIQTIFLSTANTLVRKIIAQCWHLTSFWKMGFRMRESVSLIAGYSLAKAGNESEI